MDANPRIQQQERYLSQVDNKGIGSWRRLFRDICYNMDVTSILEIGAGSPHFLESFDGARRVAIDISDRYANEFSKRGIKFVHGDVESMNLGECGTFDVVVCSDVFEHLLSPSRLLNQIGGILNEKGVLFSHVPNEFRTKKMIRVMLGRDDARMFHPNHAEWEDPHLRRFTDIGYRLFLRDVFPYSVRLTDVRLRKYWKLYEKLFSNSPLCVQGGPTYASSHSQEAIALVEKTKRMLF